jgi:uncharacterized C2H2 Zn-finger protein
VETAHEGQKPFKCPNCDADFTNEISMKKHYSMRHKEKEKTFKCKTILTLGTFVRLFHPMNGNIMFGQI